MHFTVKGDCEELEDKFIELENVVKFDGDEKRRAKRKVKKFRLCKNVLGEGGMSLVSVMSATLQQTKLSIFLYKEILVKGFSHETCHFGFTPTQCLYFE